VSRCHNVATVQQSNRTFDGGRAQVHIARRRQSEQQERAELREYATKPDAALAASLGSLGDNLRNALKGR
jgi:hypothetical protein